MAGTRASLVDEVEVAVYRVLSGRSISFPSSNPNYGVDFGALLAAKIKKPTVPQAPESAVSADTIDLVDSPVAQPISKRNLSPPRPISRSPSKRKRVAPRGSSVLHSTDDGLTNLSPSEVIEIPDDTPVRPVSSFAMEPCNKPSHIAELSPSSKPSSAKPSPTKPQPRRLAETKRKSPSRGEVSRNRPSRQWLERFKRASEHPIFLVERKPCGRAFVVMGATGSLYTVAFKSSEDPEREGTTTPVCTCPDFQKRSTGQSCGAKGPCKHIIFVFHKILRVSQFNAVMYQVALLDAEVEGIFALAPAAASVDVMADDEVRMKYRESQEDDDDDDEPRNCPICFDAMNTFLKVGEGACISCASCKNGFHAGCIERLKSATRGVATCPLCRTTWDGKILDDSLNLAEFSSRHRHKLTLAELYPESHQYIGNQFRGRGRGRRGGRGRGMGR